jgi:heme/copper-type cytochrome/quinol oxidase subunit 1
MTQKNRNLFSNKASRLATMAVVAGGFALWLGVQMFFAGLAQYEREKKSFLALFISVSPNWPMVIGAALLGLGVGVVIGFGTQFKRGT